MKIFFVSIFFFLITQSLLAQNLFSLVFEDNEHKVVCSLEENEITDVRFGKGFPSITLTNEAKKKMVYYANQLYAGHCKIFYDSTLVVTIPIKRIGNRWEYCPHIYLDSGANLFRFSEKNTFFIWYITSRNSDTEPITPACLSEIKKLSHKKMIKYLNKKYPKKRKK